MPIAALYEIARKQPGIHQQRWILLDHKEKETVAA